VLGLALLLVSVTRFVALGHGGFLPVLVFGSRILC
jgi:hypothetical protein